MRTIETTATVNPDGTVMRRLPPEIGPGEHRFVVVVEEAPLPEFDQIWPDFPTHDIGPWPDRLSLRREDMYGDDGR